MSCLSLACSMANIAFCAIKSRPRLLTTARHVQRLVVGDPSYAASSWLQHVRLAQRSALLALGSWLFALGGGVIPFCSRPVKPGYQGTARPRPLTRGLLSSQGNRAFHGIWCNGYLYRESFPIPFFASPHLLSPVLACPRLPSPPIPSLLLVLLPSSFCNSSD
jgi:hypothetical protein